MMKINFKFLIVFFILFIGCVSVGSTFATDITVDDVNDVSSIVSNVNNTNEDSDIDINITEKDCCSLVIQEENNETIFSFRQDSPTPPGCRGVRIESQDWHGYNLIKQRVDSEEDYFFHSIVLENGWVISQGGSQFNNDNRLIENITLSMVISNEISNSSLEKIRQILIPYEYGHVFIKAPDGRFGVVFVNRTFNDVLNPGEYLTIPNRIQYFDRGYYKDYDDDAVQAIIEICSWDESGTDLRNQMVYHYKPQITSEGLFYGVDLYALNCNGINIGLNYSDCVVYFDYKGVRYNPPVIPEYPDKLYVDTHIFKNKQINNVLELVKPINNSVVGKKIEVQYKVNYIIDECIIVFELDNDSEFVNAKVSTGSYYYNPKLHKLYWNISANREDKLISIFLVPKTKGLHELKGYIKGMNINITSSFYAYDDQQNKNHSSNKNLNYLPETGNPILVFFIALCAISLGLFRRKL